jgi:hypothetical protein
MEDRFPATYYQEWYYEAFDRDSDWGLSVGARLTGEYDTDLLQQAVNDLMARHDALRTTLARAGQGVVQCVQSLQELKLTDQTARGSEGGRDSDGSPRAIEAVLAEPFRVRGGELARASLLRPAKGVALLALTVHHAVCDGWSAEILYRDLAELYRARCEGRPADLPALEVQLGDYATWQRRAPSDVREAYWRERLSGDHARLGIGSGAWADGQPAKLVPWNLPKVSTEVIERLRALAVAGRTTLPRVLGAAVIVSLMWSAGEEITVALASANRHRRELREIVGDVAENIPLRVELAGDPSFADFVARFDGVVSSAHDHQISIGDVERIMRGNPERSQGPLFDVEYNYLPSSGEWRVQQVHGERKGDIERIVLAAEARTHIVDKWWKFASCIYVHHRMDRDGKLGGFLVANVNSIAPIEAGRIAERVSATIHEASVDPGKRIRAFGHGPSGLSTRVGR